LPYFLHENRLLKWWRRRWPWWNVSSTAAGILCRYDSAIIITAVVIVVRRACECHAERQKDLKHFLKFKGLINSAVTRNLVPGITANRVGSASYIFWEVGALDAVTFTCFPSRAWPPHLLLLIISDRTS